MRYIPFALALFTCVSGALLADNEEIVRDDSVVGEQTADETDGSGSGCGCGKKKG